MENGWWQQASRKRLYAEEGGSPYVEGEASATRYSMAGILSELQQIENRQEAFIMREKHIARANAAQELGLHAVCLLLQEVNDQRTNNKRGRSG